MVAEGSAAADAMTPVDVSAFLACGDGPLSAEAVASCEAVAAALLKVGLVLLRDSRVTQQDEVSFLDMMEDYFAQPTEQKLPDCHPELHYQVGATPANVELPICKSDAECLKRIEELSEENRPLPISGPDPKWRFFWRIGERPDSSPFEDLNAPAVVPKAFPQWEATMNTWGIKMHAAVTTCAAMAAVGFGLPADALTGLMVRGPHLLAPTGSDLTDASEPQRILAGWHNDLNLLTIHGKSRYPGLYVWMRDGTKLAVKIPDGCLLVQAGLQLEHLTAGAVHAGMHEVVVNEATLAARDRQRAKGRPCWRISSTLFAHVASHNVLEPLGRFASEPAAAEYAPISAGEQVLNILKKIDLAPTAH